MKNIESRSANIFQIPLGKGLTIASPESVILEFGDKGTLDVGALCYLTRDAKFNRQRRHLAKPVDLSSYCSVRSEYVGRFILHISDSVSSGLISIPTAYYQLQQGFMSYVNWCDSNEIYDSFYTEISSRSAFAKYNQYVSDRMARGEISSLTAGHTVRPLLKVLNSFLGIDNLHHGVNLVRKNINDNNPTLPAGEADQAKSLSLFKAIFDGFRDLVLNNKEYPYSIGVPKYLGLNNDCLWVFPLKKWFMHPTAKSRNIDAAKKFTAYNFKEGRVAHLDEMSEAANVVVARNLIRLAKRNINNANSDVNHYHRRDMAVLAHNAFVSMFLANTGMNLAQASKLWWSGDYSLGTERQGFRAIKWRAKGRLQSFEIQSTFFQDFKSFLELRKYLLKANEENYLFCRFGISRVGEPKRITGGVLRYFFTILQGIDPDLTVITPRQWRASKADWMLRNNVPVEITATVLQNSEAVVRASYAMGSPVTHMQEMTAFLGRVSEVVLDREQALEHSIEGPVGCCTNIGSPCATEVDAPVVPDCRNPEGCLFCDKYKVHADEKDTRKLLSCHYCIQRTSPLALSVEHFQSVFGGILARIEEILQQIDNRAIDKEMVRRVRHSVDVLGELDTYWAGKLELLIHLDLVAL